LRTKAACLLLVLLTGIPASGTAGADRDANRILRMASKQGDANSLNPHRAIASHDRVIAEMIFNGLLRYPPGNVDVTAIEPDLATALPTSEILDDGRQRWTFQLRHGVSYHPYDGDPGHELTAEDVVYSLRRAADPGRSSFAGDYDSMSFETAGPYLVTVTLENPVTPYLFLPKFVNRGGGLIVCRKALEDSGEGWFSLHPVGTGPFRFRGYTPLERVVLIAHDNYFRGKPKLAGIDYFYMPNLISRELAVRKGEVDIIWGPREQIWADMMERKTDLVVDVTGRVETMMIYFNMSVKPLDLLKVRQAIAHSLDRNEFIALYGERIAGPVYSAVPARMVGGLTREDVEKRDLLYGYDPARAKELLREAGYPDGFSLEAFTSDSDTYEKTYHLLQAGLRKIGIRLKLSVVDQSTYHTRIRQNLNPIIAYVATRPTADVILTQFHHAESIVVTGARPISNFTHLGAVDADGDGQTDSIDDKIEAARRELNPGEQVKLWQEAQFEVLRLMAAYPVMDLGYTFARKASLDWGYGLGIITDGPKAAENTALPPEASF
jgi:peptide/nickel transport system substrate-binding protein